MMNLTFHFIFVRDFLASLELLTSALIFFQKQEKRKLFPLRLIGSTIFMFGLSLLISYLVFLVSEQVSYDKGITILISFASLLILFLVQIPTMLFLYKLQKGQLYSIIIFSYVFRQVIFSSYVAIFTFINPDLVFYKFEGLNVPNLAMCLGYYAFFYMAMFIYKAKSASKDDYIREKPILIALSIAITISLFLYIVGEAYSRDESDFMYCLLLLSNVISLLLITSIEYIMRNVFHLKNENAITNQILEEKENQFKFAKANMERLHLVAHDLKHQTAILREGGVEATKVLDNIDKTVKDYESILITENQTLNVILNEKWHYCEKHSIRLSAIVNPEALSKLEIIELYNLFGNLLDNAIEAARKIKDKEKRIISLNVSYEKGVSMIDIRNYFNRVVKVKGDTSKKDKFKHGYGLKSIKSIVDKYNGDLLTKIDNDVFIVKIIIPD